MRDAETADVAIRAALTGHLVFSTLHTNDAVGAIPRLLDMGVHPSLMASTFVAIIGQRLVRQICSHCKEPVKNDEAVLKLVGLDPSPEQTFYRGKGCMHCYETGYRGRIGLFEVLAVSPSLAEMITPNVTAKAIQDKAKEDGMTTMMEDGIEKAKEGLTTLDEVVRVAYTI
jgi:type II secretory ATPase GspE/PulE/Tfp pilus assembly ATPase PilB-like protein